MTLVDFSTDVVMGRGTVYSDDCDHMGHMNVAAYTRKFDEATWALWNSIGMTATVMQDQKIGIAALESRLTYRRELFPGESFLVRSRFVWLKAKTAQFHHHLYVLIDDGQQSVETLAATCTYTAACLDRAAHKATQFPSAIAARITSVLKPLPRETAA
ncbi:MAG TPA: thioesterase [Rhodospirillaceae bacterium]|nr:thioesterase [Rhodospirillaceae bacterium]MBB58810.1 thioesterase [Rhodospirillaceae bacterium]HAE01644.1 thioesterase [Rhodospirillaceae bacterium]HAJ19177.1 thioesterase [Rhodospirillaceae bacterium]HBM12566.1 thioesterase [Rhodospirillaceae bacterium]|tara:strand:+ start:773 stop:1246 length:474 start_codon:yes stop_codon:yes gene_type:complete